MNRRCYGCMRELPAAGERCPHCGYDERAVAFSRNHLTPGTVLQGRYLIGRALGLGSFGNTYIGFDPHENVRVKIKEFLPSALAYHRPGDQQVQFYSPEGRALYEKGLRKFREETAVLRRLSDAPSVCRILDFVEENGAGYAVSEYLSGETLKVRLANCRTMDYEEAIAILTPVLETLDLVHKNGLLHRDISPENVFLCSDGRVKLLDFGSSQFEMMQDSEGLSLAIKHGYAPPEQYVPHMLVGPWTDVFGAAATLYKMVTGIVPPDAMQRSREDTLVRPSEMDCVLPAEAEQAMLRALSLKPEDRYATAEAFLAALTDADDQARDTAKTRTAITVIAAIVVLAAITVGAVLLLSGRDRPKPPAETTTKAEQTTENAAVQTDVQVTYYEDFAPDAMEPVRTAAGESVCSALTLFRKDGRCGLVDRAGVVALEAEHHNIVWDPVLELYVLDAKTCWSAQSGVTQATAFTPRQDVPDLSGSNYVYSDMLYRVTKAGTRILQTASEGSFLVGGPPFGIVTRGSLLTDQSYTRAEPLSCGVSAMEKDGKWVYINAYGVELFAVEDDEKALPNGRPYSYSEGYVPYYDAQTSLWGYRDTAGGIVVSPQFVSALPPVQGRAWVQTADGFGTIGFLQDAQKVGGSCGENLQYTFRADSGLLLIDGYGAMWDYTEQNVPWLSYRRQIRTVRFDGSVSYIGANAFADCIALSSVTLPADLQDVGPFAFRGCGLLRVLHLPEGLRTIGDEAFALCSELTDAPLPASLESLGFAAFEDCAALQTVSFGGETAVPDYAFFGCAALTDADLSHVTAIGVSAFEGCSALQSVQFPQKASALGTRAFAGCAALESARVPLGVSDVEPSVFQDCAALKTITLPDGLRTIGKEAFSGCAALDGVSLPPTLTAIGARAFYNCRGMQNALVPDSVKRIDDRAFAGCTGIASFDLKDTVQTLGSRVFEGWTARQSIRLKNPLLKRWLGTPSGWSSDWNAGCYASITAG